MGLLQDPIAALKQADWYLNNKELESFPGAFELAAGNLCRQTLEQVLFILCFFSGMPRNRYMRRNRTLHVASRMLRELDKTDPIITKKYWELARRRGNRIRKFARYPRTLKKWSRLLNEPSHFSPRFRSIDENDLLSFIGLAKRWFDEKDKYLIVAAVNELFSSGRVRAFLSNDEANTPGIRVTLVITAHHLEKSENGGLGLRAPGVNLEVISSTEVPRGRWPLVPVIVQHTVGMAFGCQFITRNGRPVDITDLRTVIASLASTRGERAYLVRRLRELGLEIQFTRNIER